MLAPKFYGSILKDLCKPELISQADELLLLECACPRRESSLKCWAYASGFPWLEHPILHCLISSLVLFEQTLFHLNCLSVFCGRMAPRTSSVIRTPFHRHLCCFHLRHAVGDLYVCADEEAGIERQSNFPDVIYTGNDVLFSCSIHRTLICFWKVHLKVWKCTGLCSLSQGQSASFHSSSVLQQLKL